MYEETEIRHERIIGPLDLDATLMSGQTGEPRWDLENGYYSDTEDFDGKAAEYGVCQVGTREEPYLRIRIVSEEDAPSLATNVAEHVTRVLTLDNDLRRFYGAFDLSSEDVITRTFDLLRGLRLMRGNNPFESLISSISTQHNSIVLWTQSVKMIRDRYGPSARLSDGSEIHLFPGPDTLASVEEKDLEKTGVAYRAKYMIEAARRVRDGKINFGKLEAKDYENAKEELMELPGVGPKVADCFLLYGLGRTEAAPVDLWIHRIVQRLYFSGARVSTEKVASFLRERYGQWAGYVQLYLFHYARMTRLL